MIFCKCDRVTKGNRGNVYKYTYSTAINENL